MKKAIVTGGAGFIGSHLSEALAERGYRVHIIDNLSTGKIENIQSLVERGGAEFTLASVTDLARLQELFTGAHFVFHLAAIASVPRSVRDPHICHDVVATGTLNTLIAARDAGARKVINISSSAVYGDAPGLPKREDMPTNPQSPYAVSKLAGEYYCKVFREIYNLQTVCLRYFNVYGPRQDPNSQYAAVVPKFFAQALEGNPPTIFGDGEQTRDFAYVKDAVNAAILCAESDATGIFNAGTGSRITVNDLARCVVKLVGRDLEPAHLESRTGDIRHSVADISRARSFGYVPKYTLYEGLEETLRYTLERTPA